MASKYLIVAFLALCLMQTLDTASVSQNKLKRIDSKSILGDIIKEAMKIAESVMKKVVEVIKGIIEDALAEMNDISHQIEQKGQEAAKEKNAALTKLEESVASEIDKAKLSAAEVGIDIAECIVDQQDQIKLVIELTVLEIGACVSHEVLAAEQQAQQLATAVQEALNFTEEVASAVTKCFDYTDAFRVLDCVVTTAEGATKEALEITRNIEQELENAGKLLLHALPNLVECAEQKFESTREEVEIILSDITKCIDDKLGLTTVSPV
ncbi:hypothetical protein C0J52_16294 [Blattella germanica]|nr:hypothetical protein C0J52_16294 [Blattella germanica]